MEKLEYSKWSFLYTAGGYLYIYHTSKLMQVQKFTQILDSNTRRCYISMSLKQAKKASNLLNIDLK